MIVSKELENMDCEMKYTPNIFGSLQLWDLLNNNDYIKND